MKNWRRTSRIGVNGTGTTLPMIISVITDGTGLVEVNFSAAVVWDLTNVSSFNIGGDPGEWVNQPLPTQLLWLSTAPNNHGAGEAWSLPGPDPELTPAVPAGQVGLTT